MVGLGVFFSVVNHGVLVGKTSYLFTCMLAVSAQRNDCAAEG